MKIKLLTDTAIIPTRGSADSAGYDLYADINKSTIILPHAVIKVPTGIAIELPRGTFGGIYARSGLATKEGLRPANCTGVIDQDYRGPVIVALRNDSDEARVIEPGERIAQLIVQPFYYVDISVVDTLSDTTRGEGGFGSTGKV